MRRRDSPLLLRKDQRKSPEGGRVFFAAQRVDGAEPARSKSRNHNDLRGERRVPNRPESRDFRACKTPRRMNGTGRRGAGGGCRWGPPRRRFSASAPPRLGWETGKGSANSTGSETRIDSGRLANAQIMFAAFQFSARAREGSAFRAPRAFWRSRGIEPAAAGLRTGRHGGSLKNDAGTRQRCKMRVAMQRGLCIVQS